VNTPPQRRSKPRLKAAVACLFAVAVLVGGVGSASASTLPAKTESTTQVTPTAKVKAPITAKKVSW